MLVAKWDECARGQKSMIAGLADDLLVYMLINECNQWRSMEN